MIRWPAGLETQYRRRLLRRLGVASALLSELELEPGRIVGAILATRTVYEMAVPLPASTLLPLAQAVDGWSTRENVRAIRRIAGINVERDRPALRALHRRWAIENAALIKRAEGEHFVDVAEHVHAAVVEGRSTEDLARLIQSRHSVAKSRARLIARDQIASLNGQITERRQTELGIRRYEWSTSGDRRVRPEHRALDGTIRRWSDPHPTEGHPGSAIACRCVAIPVVDDLEGDDR